MHSEATKAKMRAAAKRRWAAGEYDFLRKPKPPPASNWRALKVKRNREAARRQWAEGRGSTAGLFTPESRAKANLTAKTSPRVRAAWEWAVKFRIAKVRARKVRSSAIFNELEVVDLVLRYQRSGGDEEIFARIIYASLPLIDSSIRRYSPQSSADFADVRGDLILKLAALLPKYDPRRGKAFSFFTRSIKNFLVNNFHVNVRRRSRFQLTDNEELFDALDDRVSDPEEKLESEEFLERLRELLRSETYGWHWRWRWQRKGRLPLPAWRAEWRWKRLGTMAA
jgi:hypothetical protein